MTINKVIYTVIGLTILVACSSRQSPAPVSILNSQPSLEISPFEDDTYTVKSGDTLFSIAWYSGNDYKDLAVWNAIPNPYTIHIGQTLKLRRSSVNKPTLSNKPITTPPTSPPKYTKTVESPKQQAYGKPRKDVTRQVVTKNQAVKQNVFPDSVKKWVWPLDGIVIENFKQSGDVNKGIDIQAARGTSVVAAADGKVVYTGSALRGYGKLVIVKHSETFLSAYAHNDSILVKERQWIKAGEKLATVGDSGTNSVKLHFEVRYRGKSLDPLRYLPSK